MLKVFIKTMKISYIILIIFTMFLLNGCSKGIKYSINSNNNIVAITNFSLNGSLGLITGQSIVVIVPNGTNVTNLLATYTTTGTSVTVNGITQTSGISTNDFTNPVKYTVNSSNGGTSVTYTVTVTPASISSNALLQFSLNFSSSLTNQYKNFGLSATNNINNVTGVINGRNIYVKIPYGTDPSKLISSFIFSGKSITVKGIAQISGVTVNDFTNPVSYVVTAANNIPATYIVTVIIAEPSEKSITAFSLNGTSGVINEKTISVVMPYGTNITSLIATYVTSGVNVTVNSVAQQTGVTANNFSNSVVYTVFAADKSSINYTINVSIASQTAQAISLFTLNGNIASSTSLIVGNTISAIMPFGTDLTNLVAIFNTDGQIVSINGTPQTSSLTLNDFTSPVTYTVTAADETTTTYTVNVTVASNINKAITSYSLNGISGVITGSNINVLMPYGTDVTSLVATYITTGIGVTVNNLTQTSGISTNDFTYPIQYIVTASDGSISGYTVSVSNAVLQSINISPDLINGTGSTQQLTATGIFSDGLQQNLTNSVVWSESNTNIITISNTTGSQGLATAINLGSTIITAMLGTISGNTSVSVIPNAYIINDGGSTPPTICSLNTITGGLFSCASSGGSGFNQGWAIAINNDFAYITNAPIGGLVNVCNISNRILSNCGLTGSSLSSPRGIAISNGYAYIANSNNNTVTSCAVNAKVLSGCALTGSGFNAPYGITINNGYAYITNFGSNTVSYCVVNSGTLSSCATTGSGFVSPSAIAINNGFAYVTNPSPNNRVFVCTVNQDGTLTGCVDSGVGATFNNPYGIAINNGIAYIVNSNAGGSVSQCTINTTTGAFFSCANSGATVFSSPTGIAFY